MSEGMVSDSVAWQAHRRALADQLGQSEPVSDAVLEAALTHEAYAHRLMVARRNPPILKLMLDNPPPVTRAEDRTPFQLLGKAAASLARWGASGFATVDEVTLKRRRAACGACEHAQRPPDSPLYRLAGGLDAAICGQCGCNLANKTRFPHETCPSPDPDRPGVTRWGDPIVGTSEASRSDAA